MTCEVDAVGVILSVGSNCGDRYSNVEEGIDWLSSHVCVSGVSDIYSTPDCHGGPTHYMNAVVAGTTNLSIEQLEVLCKAHEVEKGRDEKARAAGMVPLDIDVVIYNGTIIREKDYSQTFFKIGFSQLA